MSLVKALKYGDHYADFNVEEFANTLEKAYESQRRESSVKKKKSFAPSGVGYGSGTCPRYWYYAFQGETMFEDSADALSVASMSYGTEAHARIQKLFNSAEMLVQEEMVIKQEDPPIFGYLDALVKWHGEEIPVEIKTTRQEMFVFRQTTGEPPFYNLLQILLYMHILKKKRGMLLYENKNTQELFVIPVEMDEKHQAIVDRTMAWMKEVYSNTEMPKRPFSRKSKPCSSCPVRKQCWEDEDGLKILSPLDTEVESE